MKYNITEGRSFRNVFSDMDKSFPLWYLLTMSKSNISSWLICMWNPKRFVDGITCIFRKLCNGSTTLLYILKSNLPVRSYLGGWTEDSIKARAVGQAPEYGVGIRCLFVARTWNMTALLRFRDHYPHPHSNSSCTTSSGRRKRGSRAGSWQGYEYRNTTSRGVSDLTLTTS